MKDRFLNLWYGMTLRKKLYVIIGSVCLVMAASIFINVKVTYFFIDHARVIMDDNLSTYKFQDALTQEVDCFSAYMMSRTVANKEAYEDACDSTKKYLDKLPSDYEKIGNTRYAVTWNIRNGYEGYALQRDKVISMQPDAQRFVTELYATYRMQNYLKNYAARLTKAVLTEGNSYYESQIPRLRSMPLTLVFISISAFVVLFMILRGITGSIVKVVIQLAHASKKIEVNDFSDSDIRWDGKDEIGQLVRAFDRMKAATADSIKSAEEKRMMEEMLHHQELERTELEQRFSMAQLQLIKSQINPHFLFNTLNMITRMAQMEEAPVTEEMLVAISNLLRYSLRTTNAFAPLEQELKIINDYMYIQKMRFGSRIRWKVDCEPNLSEEQVPVFLLQPLVENAVIHGITDKEDGGSICIRIKKRGEHLWISVADTGMGIDQERLEEIRDGIAMRGTRLGIGLGNIYRRLSAYYAYRDVFIDSRVGHGTVVQIEFGERKDTEE